MNLFAVFSICVLAVSADPVDIDIDILSSPANVEGERLYNSIVSGDIDRAVAQTLALDLLDRGTIVEDVVTRLITEKKNNIFEYAYKLWTGDGDDVVKDHFPVQFRLIFSEKHVKLVSRRDNLAIKLSAAVDDQKDRSAWGDANDKTTDNVAWRFVYLWDDNKVYFKIISVSRYQFLKLGTAVDDAGEHIAYGSDKADTHRHHWYLQAAFDEKDLVFIIFNREFKQALKLGRAVDDKGDRRLYSQNGDVSGSPHLYGFGISAV